MNEYMKRIETMANYVDNVPGMNIVEVIRCRECYKRWHDGYCTIMKQKVPEDGYCHEGKINRNE